MKKCEDLSETRLTISKLMLIISIISSLLREKVMMLYISQRRRLVLQPQSAGTVAQGRDFRQLLEGEVHHQGLRQRYSSYRG